MVDVSISNLLKAIAGPFRTTVANPVPIIPSTLSVSAEEFQRIADSIHAPDRKENNQSSLMNDLNPVHSAIVKRKFDNERIRELAPEVKKASTIMVSSILSPNNLQSGSLSFNIDNNELSENTKLKIVTLIKDHFTSIGLEAKLKQWLDNALYNVGSSPVMVLPEEFLTSLIKKEIKPGVGLESLDINMIKEKMFEDSIYSNGKPVTFKAALVGTSVVDNELIDDVKVGFEKYVQIHTDDQMKELRSDRLKTKLTSIEKAIINKIDDKEPLLSMCEHPSIVGLASLRASHIKAASKHKLNTSFKKFTDMKYELQSFMSLEDIELTETGIGNPLLIEPPAESIIPIFPPGSPHSHCGYIAILDNKGNFIDVTSEPSDDDIGSLKTSFNALLGANGLSEIGNIKNNKANFEAINRVYEQMVDKYLITSLKNMGVEDMSISNNPAIYRCMFRRLLGNKQTKLLYIPDTLMTYIRFDHHNDGTGKSKLDSIKFALSLRITFLVSRILTVMEEAVVREKVNIKLDPKVANPIGFMKAIDARILKSKIFEFTTDPNQIATSIAKRGMSLMPMDIPGIEQFDISSEPNPKSSGSVDDSINDETNDMVITGLGVPHSAMNKLSEDEYSRSLATVDLLFSKEVSDFQFIFCNFLNKLIRTYITYSAPIRKGIITILEEADAKQTTSVQNDSTDDETMDVSSYIDEIYVGLPAPNIAPDNAIYEDFEKYNDMVDNLLNSVYPEDMLDRELSEQLTSVKMLVKSKLIKTYLTTIGFSSALNIPEIDEIDTTDLVKFKRSIANLTARLKGVDKLVKSDGDGDYQY